jgi:hypothetical protein
MEVSKLTAPKERDIEWAKGIADTIRKQIKYPNKYVFFSWGAHNFVFGVTEDGNKPTLRFKVNGMKFKGYVHIIYNLMDYYEVEFVSTHGNLKKRVEMCYFDQLQEIIDNYVEKIPEYEF